MLDPKVAKQTFLGYDLLCKSPQLRNVPLTITEFVNKGLLGFMPGSPVCLISFAGFRYFSTALCEKINTFSLNSQNVVLSSNEKKRKLPRGGSIQKRKETCQTSTNPGG